MSRRTERVAHLIRNTIGQLLLSKIADPRIDPARTSVTRVEVPEDLLTARVYISVLGSPTQQKLTLQALRHAAGHIQDLMARQVQLRNTPMLNFVADESFKKTLDTLGAIERAMTEIREKEARQAEQAGEGVDNPGQAEESSGEDAPDLRGQEKGPGPK
ncbi:MAG: 30S ribosome-binding factor RbfA [Phycisphaerae bacterium]|jgi:ribosome-binding factor A